MTQHPPQPTPLLLPCLWSNTLLLVLPKTQRLRQVASAPVNEYVASARVIEYVAPTPVTTLLETPVQVVQVVHVPQVQDHGENR